MNDPRRLPSRIGTLAAIVIAVVLTIAQAAGATVTAEQTFRLVFTADPTQAPGTIVATGPVTGVGRVRVTARSGEQILSTYEFAEGTLSVAATPLGGSFEPNLTNCTARATSTSRVDILGGTGSFLGASGTGVATSTAFLVGQRGPAGECLLGQQPPARGVEVVTVRITLSLPGEV